MWDDTKILNGEIGEYISVARKNKNKWFIGAITNNEGRTITIPFDFLTPGKRYRLSLYTDGGDKVNTRTQVAIRRQAITSKTKLKFQLLPRGGCAMIAEEI